MTTIGVPEPKGKTVTEVRDGPGETVAVARDPEPDETGPVGV